MTLNIFFCKRGSAPWEGGLIILAENEQRAIDLFSQSEDQKPKSVSLLNTDSEGVLYNDESR